MHEANMAFWRKAQTTYPWAFQGVRVLEVGSHYVNGSVRVVFEADCDYTGLDWRPGPNVDCVALAHEAPFDDASFRTIISASMLEHDPYWERSLAKMVRLLRSDGILLLSWGAAENPQHNNETAPDGEFHALPAGAVLRVLGGLGVTVHEFGYEQTFHPIDAVPGGVALIGFLDPTLGVGAPAIEALHEADLIDQR